jgi:hypothetical protein
MLHSPILLEHRKGLADSYRLLMASWCATIIGQTLWDGGRQARTSPPIITQSLVSQSRRGVKSMPGCFEQSLLFLCCQRDCIRWR